jgi:hypothetical protein
MAVTATNLRQVTSQNSEGHNELLINKLVTLFSVRELNIQNSLKDTDLLIFTLEYTHLYIFALRNRSCVHVGDFSMIAMYDIIIINCISF